LRSLTSVDFDEYIGSRPAPTLVDFWAEWCAPCHQLKPILAALESEYQGAVHIATVDVHEDPGLGERFGVRSLPTLVLFDTGGRSLWRASGVKRGPFLRRMLHEHLGLEAAPDLRS